MHLMPRKKHHDKHGPIAKKHQDEHGAIAKHGEIEKGEERKTKIRGGSC